MASGVRLAISDWFAAWPDRIFVYRRKRRAKRAQRRLDLDYATSVLLGLCYKIEVETGVYMAEGRDLRNLVNVFVSVKAQVEELRKGLQ